MGPGLTLTLIPDLTLDLTLALKLTLTLTVRFPETSVLSKNRTYLTHPGPQGKMFLIILSYYIILLLLYRERYLVTVPIRTLS